LIWSQDAAAKSQLCNADKSPSLTLISISTTFPHHISRLPSPSHIATPSPPRLAMPTPTLFTSFARILQSIRTRDAQTTLGALHLNLHSPMRQYNQPEIRRQ
jgi:hypothetical protein